MKNYKIKTNQLIELNKDELQFIHGGDGILYRIGNWIGCKIRDAYSSEGGTYDRDSEVEALDNYGAPY
jgi:hypothetical protein